VLVTGSPGGRTIINTVLQIVLNVVEFDMDPSDAVAAPRQHHQWFPDELLCEGSANAKYADALQQLKDCGHKVTVRSSPQGSAHSIWVDPQTGEYVGVADRRRGGEAAGVADPSERLHQRSGRRHKPSRTQDVRPRLLAPRNRGRVFHAIRFSMGSA
jgi:hypothetical protein